jgi:hypothetical protein
MYDIKLKIKECKNISSLKEFVKLNNIKLVLFGEYHGFFKQIQVQREILNRISPDFFLYEMLEDNKILSDKDAKKVLSKPNKKNFSVVSTYGQLKPIIKLARSFNLPIIGCDIKNMGADKNWRGKKFSEKEAKFITKKRELQQAKIINQYTSKGLVFALVGEYHLRKNSPIFTKLRVKKAILVRPSFKWKDELSYVENIKKSDIAYSIKLFRK